MAGGVDETLLGSQDSNNDDVYVSDDPVAKADAHLEEGRALQLAKLLREGHTPAQALALLPPAPAHQRTTAARPRRRAAAGGGGAKAVARAKRQLENLDAAPDVQQALTPLQKRSKRAGSGGGAGGVGAAGLNDALQ